MLWHPEPTQRNKAAPGIPGTTITENTYQTAKSTAHAPETIPTSSSNSGAKRLKNRWGKS